MNPLRRILLVAGFAASTSVVSPSYAQDVDACIAANEQAVALRKAQRWIASRAALAVCASASCPDVVQASCRQRLDEAAAAIPTVVFSTVDEAGRDLANVSVTVDGSTPQAVDGRALTLDPGDHQLRFELTGHRPVLRRLSLALYEQNRRERIVMVGNSGADVTTSVPEVGSQGGGQRTAAIVGVTLGLASLATGGVFGALSLAAHDAYIKECGPSGGVPAGYCNQAGFDGERDAATKGTLATAFLAAGGLVTAASVVLFVTAPRGRTSAAIGLEPCGLSLRGTF
jgi:hypothetical protein